MKKHLSRTILIYAAFAIGLVLIYPTIGWMLLSPEQRVTRQETWAAEDAVYHEPSVVGDTTRTVKRWAQFDRSRVINLGLDLQGGVHMVIGFDLTQEQIDQGVTEEYVQRLVLQRIRRRISEFEAQEPIVQALGQSQIQIQLPGEKDVDRAKRLIMKTALLTFHIAAGQDETTALFKKVKDQFPDRFTPFLLPPPMGRPFFRVPEEYVDKIRAVIKEAEAIEGFMPENKMMALSQPPNPWDDYKGYYLYVLDKAPLMTGEGLRMATARPDEQSPGRWEIIFEFTGEAARQFGEVTEANIGRNMAIVVDGVVASAPVIKSKITNVGSITGDFGAEEATDLSIALTSGSMPVQLREDYTGVVGASLGADSVRKGVLSSVVGLLIVVLFMIVYYRLAGVIADFALVLNAVLILAAMAYFRSTLTLPGVAGLILTIGMAVDANVLIFERIREELRNGKSLLAAVESGYSRATITILDANVTTLIAAAVLMQFGTGPIKGFAVTLSIGICSSVFTALVVTRAVFDFLAEGKTLSKLTMMSLVKPNTKIPFMGRMRFAFIGSIVVIALGLAVFGMRGAGNFGVDFTEGTNLIIGFNTDEAIDVGAVRSELESAGFYTPIVQELAEDIEASHNRFVIRIGQTAETFADAGEDVTISSHAQQALAGLVGGDVSKVDLEKVETVGPAVGKELRQDALKAIIGAFVFILAYLWFRFELRFAVGALIALVHDVLITVGIFALVGREISMGVIAALLTIIGYSLNDTIVVFDRVREDMKLYRGRGMHFSEILNVSINQTLSRTLLTSLTTLFVTLVLFIFGGSGINDFAFALSVGVVVGTYSSIFIASPVVYLWQKIQGKHVSPSSQGRGAGGKGKERRSKKANSTA